MLLMASDAAPQVFVGAFFLLFMLIPFALGVGLLIFWVWTLVDCINNTPSEENLKLVWVLVILFGSWVGSLVYLFVQRPKNQALE